MSDNGVLIPLDQLDKAPEDQVREQGWAEPTKFDYGRFEPKRETKFVEANEQEDTVETGWASNSAKYEWSDEYGDVGPESPELEAILFRGEHQMRKGECFETLAKISVTFESKLQIMPILNFEDAGLHPVVLKNVELCGYEHPTPIQSYVLPAILKGHDVVGVAQTGSGKTAAFLIPIISKLMGKAKKLCAPRPYIKGQFTRDQAVRAEPLVLIVVPTRELSTQIFDEARRLCYRSMLRPCVIYGGAPSRDQMDDLQRGCDILIATPGRLKDFCERDHLLTLRRVKYTVVDEADEMVSADWASEMELVMGGADGNDDDDHIYMMFSATFPKEARAVAKEYMADEYVRIRVGRAGSSHHNITQTVVQVDESAKRECLWDLLLSMPPARTLIFVNNKKGVDFLDDFLFNRKLPTTSMHSDRNQCEREDSIRAFKTGKAPILITTGLSARGLDIRNVMHVINYELPSSDYGGIDEYVHRIGRTARIGNVGVATSLYTERNEDIAEALTKVLIECKQAVPDFLQAYVPEAGEDLAFNDDTDDEIEAGEAGGDGWGAVAAPPQDAPEAAGGWGGNAEASAPAAGWGGAAEASTPATAGWGAGAGASTSTNWS